MSRTTARAAAMQMIFEKISGGRTKKTGSISLPRWRASLPTVKSWTKRSGKRQRDGRSNECPR